MNILIGVLIFLLFQNLWQEVLAFYLTWNLYCLVIYWNWFTIISLILPHLSYCNHLWGNTFKSHLKKLHILQKKSVRIITKSNFYSPSAPLFKTLHILPIYDLLTLNTLIFMFSVNSKLLPEKYCNMFVLNANFHSYSTRQKHYFHLPNVKLTLSLNSLSLCRDKTLESIRWIN